MYRLMRNVHLILGLVFVLALGVYLLSSVRLAHRSWFSSKPTLTEETFSVDPGEAGTPRALARILLGVGLLMDFMPGRVRWVIRRLVGE